MSAPLRKAVTLRASAALAAVTTEYGVYDTAKLTSTTTATTSNKLTDSAGNFVVNGIAIGDVIKNTTTGKYALVTAVDSATALSVSADVFLNTNTYAIYPNAGYSVGAIPDEAIFVLDVSAAATDVGDTLDVMIDTSFDGGLTFVNIGHFTQVLGNGGAKNFVMAFRPDDPGAAAVYTTGTDATAGVTRPLGLGDRFRHRATLVDANANASFTYSLKGFFKGASTIR